MWKSALALFSLGLVTSSAYADDYNDYLKKLQEDLGSVGMQVDVYDRNPFQTGTTLLNYYINEKTLLLGRETYFSMKANDLQTTDQVADYQFRTKVLRSHAGNMLIQLMQAIKLRNEEGFVKVEGPKNQKDFEAIVNECKQDAACVEDRIKNPETSMVNILVDNFALATSVFQQIPYMHVLEVNAAYNLVQLMYVEVFYAQSNLARVEFDLFLEKQRAALEQVKRNSALLGWEKEFQLAMIENLVSKWKKRILERKFDHSEEFERKARELKAKNRELLAQIESLHAEAPHLYRLDWEVTPCRSRYQIGGGKEICVVEEGFDLRGRCEKVMSFAAMGGQACVNTRKVNQEDLDAIHGFVGKVRQDGFWFMGQAESALPEEFYEKVGGRSWE